MSLLGRAAWWLPRWLDVLLPKVGVEGERLRAELEKVSAVTAPHRPAPYGQVRGLPA